MTPAINAAKKAKLSFNVHEYQHDPNAESYGEEAAQALGLDPQQVFKTLLVSLTGHKSPLGVAVLPVSHMLSLKAIAKALGAKKAEMADPKVAERTTGYVVGGISPIGQKKKHCPPSSTAAPKHNHRSTSVPGSAVLKLNWRHRI